MFFVPFVIFFLGFFLNFFSSRGGRPKGGMGRRIPSERIGRRISSGPNPLRWPKRWRAPERFFQKCLFKNVSKRFLKESFCLLQVSGETVRVSAPNRLGARHPFCLDVGWGILKTRDVGEIQPFLFDWKDSQNVLVVAWLWCGFERLSFLPLART